MFVIAQQVTLRIADRADGKTGILLLGEQNVILPSLEPIE
jgi:hypothetical protein